MGHDDRDKEMIALYTSNWRLLTPDLKRAFIKNHSISKYITKLDPGAPLHKANTAVIKAVDIYNAVENSPIPPRPERFLAKTYLDYIPIKQAYSILDFGCKDLIITKIYKQRLRAKRVYCIELPETVAEHKDTAVASQIKMFSYRNNAYKSPLPDNFINLITCTHVFHHVPAVQRPAIIKDFVRVLSPGGYLLFIDHDVTNQELAAYINLMHLFFAQLYHEPLEFPLPYFKMAHMNKQFSDAGLVKLTQIKKTYKYIQIWQKPLKP
jgi:SAM-dependent methyltransferase